MMFFMCFNNNLKTVIVTNIPLEQRLYIMNCKCVFYEKLWGFSPPWCFSCVSNKKLKTESHKYHIGTASLQNELQVCVLRKTLRFLSSMMSFMCFINKLKTVIVTTITLEQLLYKMKCKRVFKKNYEVFLLHVCFSCTLISTWKQQKSQI